jgi:hypothetical protein
MNTDVVEGCGLLLLEIEQKITRTNNKEQVLLVQNATFWNDINVMSFQNCGILFK